MKLNLENIVDALCANEKVVELVKIMQPSDVMAVVSVDLGLQKKDAHNVVSNLIKKIEGLSGPSVDAVVSNRYPVPSSLRRGDKDANIEEDGNFINNLGSLNVDMNPDYFPPQPMPDPQDWPYDDATVAYMDPMNKGRKRSHTESTEDEPGTDPFNANLKKRLQPGGDYGGSQGIYSRNSSHFDNSTSSSGRSYDGKGRPGWSRTPPGKEFDMPIDKDDMPKSEPIANNEDEIDAYEKIFGPSPVGSAIPQFQGGSSQQRRMGFRRR